MIKKKIFLIGNFSFLKSNSMNNYSLLYKNTLKKKLNIRLIRPSKIMTNLNINNKNILKWFGYVDNYILFGFKLLLLIKKTDIVHICNHSNSIFYPFIRSKNILITCHDLINIKRAINVKNNNYPKLSLTGHIYQYLIVYFLNKFKKIICVSKNTQNELIKYLNIKKKNTEVIYNSIDINFIKNKKNFIAKSDFKYFLHVGNNNFYKNKLGLINIFYELLKYKKFSNHKLILAGKKNSIELDYLIKKLFLKKKVINIISPSFSKLSKLYLDAEALIFPSHEEGFGIPLIEAQYFGCLVITSNKMPMKEILKKSCIYISPNNFFQSAKLIKKNYFKKKRLINLGIKNSNNFNIKKISNQYLKLYNQF